MGVMQTVLPGVCMAAIAATSAVAQVAPVFPPGTNFGKCTVSLGASGSSKNAAAIAVSAAAEVSLAICDTSSAQFSVSEESIAIATATAAATAIAEATAACFSSGQAKFKVNGQSLAVATATAWASAFAEATASATVCNKCSTQASVVGSVVKEVILRATAKAELKLDSALTPNVIANILVVDIREETVVAIAQALAEARASARNGCEVSVVIDGAAGLESNPDTFFCNVQSNALDRSIKQDAIVNAAAIAVAAAGCGKSDNATAVAAAEKLAIAAAIVLSEVVVACDTKGSANACFFGASDIKTTVTATARVFARAFANATSTCPKALCQADIDVVTGAIATVLASAAASAQASSCIGGNTVLDLTVSEFVSNTTTIKAIANIIVSASVVGGVCDITVKDILAATVVSAPQVVKTEVLTITINGVPQTFAVPQTPAGASNGVVVSQTSKGASVTKAPVKPIVTPVKPVIKPIIKPVKPIVKPVIKPIVKPGKCAGCVPDLGLCAGPGITGIFSCCTPSFKCVPLDKSGFFQCRSGGKSQYGVVLPILTC